ncbi:oligosaccharide flippase family protein [Thalassotalea castellviae]|uniref:Oligosaccharide flippase family protein n=1 Tax=Thalassotalea castellviae TaxID=3075612 RepID=A0ABU3A0U9_9GAMM|nr:oligosaccharide flippase family protein [Thalassotalea sp. W431]MDT0603805.1 oligosaccharide flippase family protein [Thalassotalea sp. W431]
MRTSLQAAMAAINLYSEYFLGLIVSLTIARNLSTEDYGLYSSIIWIAGLITLAINSGLAINVTKFVAEFTKKDNGELPGILAYFWRIQHIRIAIVVVLAITILGFQYGQTKMELWLLVILFLCAVVKADYMFRMAIFKGIKKYDVLAKTSLITNPFNIVAVLTCALFSPKLEYFVLIYCGTCLMYGASARLFNKNLPKSSWQNNTVKQHKDRIIAQMLSATGIVFLSALIFKQSQVVFLEHNNLLSEAGFFNIAFLLSTAAITLIPGIYQEILLPKITDAVQNNDVNAQVAQAEKYLMALSLLVVAPMIFYADVIIEILYGQRYQGAVLPLQVMIVLKTILTLNQGANLTLISYDKQVGMLKIKAFLFLCALIISLISVPLWGLKGALLTYGTLTLLSLVLYSHLAKQCGYKMISIRIMYRISLAAVIASIPMLLLDQLLNGLLSAIIGTLIYVVVYLNLLFVTKGYDRSVGYLLKQIRPKLPQYCHSYLSWAIKRLVS